MKMTADGYYTNRHSCFLLQYHLVLVTKFRKGAIEGVIEEDLVTYAKEFFDKKGLSILEMETMPDHIHILFEAPPQVNLADFVNSFKTCSSRRLRQRFTKEIEKHYEGPFFWSQTYFIGSASEQSASVVKKYIQNQKGDK